MWSCLPTLLLSRVTSRPRFSAEEGSEVASPQTEMVAGVKTGDGLEDEHRLYEDIFCFVVAYFQFTFLRPGLYV